MITKGIVRDFGNLIKRAEERTIKKIKDGRIETEPSITDRFFGDLEGVFKEYEASSGIIFKVRTLRGIGPNAPEREFGADICGVMDIKLPDFAQQKGFLTQAKNETNWIKVLRTHYGVTEVKFSKNKEFKRLQNQTNEMLSVTPDSFVIVYDLDGFVVVPASSVQGLNPINNGIYGKPVDRFFKEFIMCFIGDPGLKAHDDETLRDLRKEMKAQSAVMFQIRGE